MWGINHSEVEPDMVTIAKGIANGMPLAAIITKKEIADSMQKNTISTFGGNPVSCAASSKTIDIIKRDRLEKNAEKMGLILIEGLKKIQADHPKIIGDIRGMGLMVGLELVVDETIQDRTPNSKAVDALMEETKERSSHWARWSIWKLCSNCACAKYWRR